MPQPDTNSGGNNATQRKLNKLFRDYDNAYFGLIGMREHSFPVGTRVKSRMDPNFTITVTEGSLYADQVNTNFGHMSWRYLEKADD